MISLFKKTPETEGAVPNPIGGDLQDVLLRLARFGRPGLRRSTHSDGWHCYVDMAVNQVGASFEIKSEFDLPTPLAAALQCEERAHEALKKIGGNR